MRATFVIAHLTLHEAARKRVLAAALIIGAAFVLVYATGMHFMMAEALKDGTALGAVQRRVACAFLTLAGLYAANSLTAMAAVLLPIDTLSGEIASGVAQTVASKPLRRSDIVLGKWLAYVAVVLGYLLLVVGGVIATSAVIGHYVPPRLHIGLPLLALESVALVTLSIAGGTRFATVTNGMLAFGLYGVAFLGGWIEQAGAMSNTLAVRNVGAVASLVMPTESMWQLAAWNMQPHVMAMTTATPFSPASVPSAVMVAWAVGWTLAVLAAALRGFSRRPL